MAKIKSEKVYKSSKDGRQLQYTKEVHVDSDGCFKVLIPEELYNRITDDKKKGQSRGPKFYFIGKTLKEVEETEREAIRLWQECEVESKLVILFRSDNQYNLYGNSQGEFDLVYTSNDEKSRLLDGSDNMFMKRLTLQLEIKILKLCKYTSGEFSHEAYESFPKSEIPESNIYSRKLYSSAVASTNSEYTAPRGFNEVPFTEANAKFFYDMILGMSIMGYNMKRFLEKDSKELELMINRNSNFNLLEHKKNKAELITKELVCLEAEDKPKNYALI